MNKKTITLSLATAFTSAAITASLTSAYRGNPNVPGPNYTPERHEAMEEALEKRNFQTWKELHNGRGRISQVIDSQEKFEKMAEAHELMEEGKVDEAHEIMADLMGNSPYGFGMLNHR